MWSYEKKRVQCYKIMDYFGRENFKVFIKMGHLKETLFSHNINSFSTFALTTAVD